MLKSWTPQFYDDQSGQKNYLDYSIENTEISPIQFAIPCKIPTTSFQLNYVKAVFK